MANHQILTPFKTLAPDTTLNIQIDIFQDPGTFVYHTKHNSFQDPAIFMGDFLQAIGSSGHFGFLSRPCKTAKKMEDLGQPDRSFIFIVAP